MSHRGELRDDVDPDAAIDLVIGPALYRLMIGHAPLTEEAADATCGRGHPRPRPE